MESLKFDVRVRERLHKKGIITEAEVKEHLAGNAYALRGLQARSSSLKVENQRFRTDFPRLGPGEHSDQWNAAVPQPRLSAAVSTDLSRQSAF